jgi:hypothetical protein
MHAPNVMNQITKRPVGQVGTGAPGSVNEATVAKRSPSRRSCPT